MLSSKKSCYAAAILSLFILSTGLSPAASAQAAHMDGNGILNYLDKLIAWQRAVGSFGTSPRNAQEALLKDAIHQSSLKALSLGFDFARAESYALENNGKEEQNPDNAAPDTDQKRRIAAAAAAAAKQLQDAQASLQTIAQQLKSAKAADRPLLLAKRDKQNSAANLAKAQQSVIQKVNGSLNGPDTGDNGDLLDKIDDMARSTPELQPDAQKPAQTAAATATTAATAATAAATAAQHATSPGIFGLAGEMFDLARKKSDVDALVQRTAAIQQANNDLRVSIRNTLQDAIQRAAAITKADGNDVTAIETQTQQLDDLTDNFKAAATAMPPLVEEGVWLDASQHSLQDWRTALSEQMGAALRSLILRLGMLGIAVAVPLVVSEALRRATVRYIRDPRRQQLLKRLRQWVVSAVIVVIVILSFATEFGSLATFAGIITAGLAVALQNVILSAVAYFFFFGRFGVRTGDRVSVNGVTGDVVQIGIIRLYLMELGGTNLDLYPTGRIVAFPNSILFQNNAFFKQIPGTNYSWHEITLPLAADTDYEQANKELLAAVETIYTAYRPDMDRQQTALMESTHLQVEAPRPKGWLRFTDGGLAFIIRYPVEIGSATEVDERITKQLLQTISGNAALKLSGAPKIQNVAS